MALEDQMERTPILLTMNKLKVKEEIDYLLGLAKQTIRSNEHYRNSRESLAVDRVLYSQLHTSALSFAARIFGKDSPHFLALSKINESANVNFAQYISGILNTMNAEFVRGWMDNLRGLIAADLFSDFLDMAAHLLSEGYKDAAAVMIGSVLEQRIRELSVKNGLPITKPTGEPMKADAMNAELLKAGIYNKGEQKSVTAWLDLRNDAAHGHYQNYDKAKVELMLMGVRDFVQRHP